jgi:hypothetical protein
VRELAVCKTRRGSALIINRQNFEVYDKFFDAAPPRSKGFCIHKNAFTLPPLINSEQLAINS